MRKKKRGEGEPARFSLSLAPEGREKGKTTNQKGGRGRRYPYVYFLSEPKREEKGRREKIGKEHPSNHLEKREGNQKSRPNQAKKSPVRVFQKKEGERQTLLRGKSFSPLFLSSLHKEEEGGVPRCSKGKK